MAISQPTHLICPGYTTGMSGANITNYGSDGTNFAVQQGSSPTNYEQVPNADAKLGYLDLKTKTLSNMPWITTSASAFANTLVTLNIAAGFTVDSLEGVVGQKIYTASSNNAPRILINSPSVSGDFDIVVRMYTTSGGGYEYTYSSTTFGANLTFGTEYRLAASLDVTTPTAAIIKFKLNSSSVVTSPSQNISGQVLNTSQPWLNRDADFTTYGGNDGQLEFFAYERGGTAWGDSDLASVTSDPATAFAGWWPGGGGGGGSTLAGRLSLLGVGL